MQLLIKSSELGEKNRPAPKFIGLSNLEEILEILKNNNVEIDADLSSEVIKSLPGITGGDI